MTRSARDEMIELAGAYGWDFTERHYDMIARLKGITVRIEFSETGRILGLCRSDLGYPIATGKRAAAREWLTTIGQTDRSRVIAQAQKHGWKLSDVDGDPRKVTIRNARNWIDATFDGDDDELTLIFWGGNTYPRPSLNWFLRVLRSEATKGAHRSERRDLGSNAQVALQRLAREAAWDAVDESRMSAFYQRNGHDVVATFSVKGGLTYLRLDTVVVKNDRRRAAVAFMEEHGA